MDGSTDLISDINRIYAEEKRVAEMRALNYQSEERPRAFVPPTTIPEENEKEQGDQDSVECLNMSNEG